MIPIAPPSAPPMPVLTIVQAYCMIARVFGNSYYDATRVNDLQGPEKKMIIKETQETPKRNRYGM